jgi:glucokinase
MILAGDIGGTKTTLALYDAELRQQRVSTYRSREFLSFEPLLRSFLGKESGTTIDVTCIGIAGPVLEGECKTTNLPWIVSEKNLTAELRAERVKLLNDLEATAFGILHLQPKDFVTLQQGVSPTLKGNMAVIAAGTGLGEAMLCWDGEQHNPTASQGGLADLAPRTDLEMELAKFLKKEFGTVSWERALSGPGLWNIYRFLRDSGYGEEPDWLKARLSVEDPSPIISEIALAKKALLCEVTLDLFTALYGAETGNLVLKAFAVGGVFVAGGIANKILPKLHDGTFMRTFRETGGMTDLMKIIPVKVVQNPRAALLGAAHYARERLWESRVG